MKHFISFLLAASLCACASQGGTSAGDAADSAVQQTGDGLTDAALSPLEDLNLKRTQIPPVLADLSTTYGLPEPLSCQSIADEVTRLTAVLGQDNDIPPPEGDDEDRGQWAADKSSEAALGAVESSARGFIPFRGLVREVTGANSHASKVARAYQFGLTRRAFLKGYGQAMGCTWPAAPLDALPETGKIVYN
ncbi:MAG: hypothetical protein MRY64_01490 [Hyphomonadaceae bacterium]|nr:hypothetical protein [Hyphomonadaceae bacterium]